METDWQKSLRTLGIVSFVGVFLWAGFVTLLLPLAQLAQLGDGSRSIVPTSAYFFLYSGSVYLLFVSLSCLPFVRGWLLIAVGIIANLTLVFFAYCLFKLGGLVGLVLLTFFAYPAVRWFVLCKNKVPRYNP